MWRIALSMGLMFGAMAWSAFAIIIIFLIVPYAWGALFGEQFAVPAALGAVVLAIWGSMKMMTLADRLSGMAEGRSRRREATVAVQPDMPANWPEYNAAIARNKRWAFYRRTHQYDRLRELEAESQASGQTVGGRSGRGR